ncbi:tail fiber domain-containing protein [Ferruginibacter sp. SUN002]|uniref:tail fiber domain-containing protein n=1 Tax=Ferruginibacter sp. SUN002 TaxID=2937789 RepID=UPI003D366F20
MKRNILIVAMFVSYTMVQAQNVGIGTNEPKAGLHIINNNGFIARGEFNSGVDLPDSGLGTRLIWYPKKAAFRAGRVAINATTWNDAEIGIHSIGLGLETKAKGNASISLGAYTQALGSPSVALGFGSVTTEPSCVAIGSLAKANANNSTAIGYNALAGYTTTRGQYSFAIGNGTTSAYTTGGHFAIGDNSFAIGNQCYTLSNGSFAIGNGSSTGLLFNSPDQGFNSYAIGNSCLATGNYSFAIGNNSNTNGHSGSFVIAGRTDGVQVVEGFDNHMLMQFAGGYHFQTNLAASLGVYMNPSGNSWLSFCDKNKKEATLLMNDEEVLKKIGAIDYYSWRYKDDPDKTNRHYGVMAQDFYNAFGKDELGVIGNDTAVNPIDMLGVVFSAIKALEKRTTLLEAENERLQTELANIKRKKRTVENE